MHTRLLRDPRAIAFLTVFATAMLYALYTGNVWEDYWITFRASKNLALGNGLLFTPGQRVHSFTSPIGTLLPALLSALFGPDNDMPVFWTFRAMGAAALAAGVALLVDVAMRERLSRFSTALLVALVGVDAKTLAFSTNGQETGFLIFFLALTLHALLVASRRPVLRLGLAWAGLMWTRPDGAVYVAAISLAFLLFNAAPAVAATRAGLVRKLAAAGCVCAACYGPWFVWTWVYYGTPVPHTVVAKGLDLADGGLAKRIFWYVTGRSMIRDGTFLPTYWNFGGWPELVVTLGAFFFAGLYWLVPSRPRAAAAISLAFLLCHVYVLGVAALFPWYYPGIELLAFVAVAYAMHHLATVEAASRVAGLVRALVASLVAVSAVTTVGAAYQLEIQQRVVESNRKRIGLWLRDHAASPSDTVFLECLGYIGYFSGLKTYDYPGMSSPEVVAARRRARANGPRDRAATLAPQLVDVTGWGALIADLRPDWLVLRPQEAAHVSGFEQGLLGRTYVLAATFDVSGELGEYGFIPGRPYLEFDQTFFVFERADHHQARMAKVEPGP